MSSARALTCLAGLAAAVGLLEAGCGSSGPSADSTTPAAEDGGGPNAEGGGGDAGTAGPSVDGPFTFRDRLAGWSGGYTGGWYAAHGYAIAGKRLFSLPDALSSSLGAVTVVDVSTDKPRVFALPVAGKVPSGTVESFVYDPASDRIVMIVRTYAATQTETEIVTLAVGDKEATFTTLTQAGPKSTSNSLVGPLYATGAAGVIVAGFGDTTASFTIAGTTATWAPESKSSLYQGNQAAPMEDSAHGRVLSFGKDVYDPATMTAHVEPVIQTLSLAAPYTWTALPSGGDAPPIGDNLAGYSFTVYDEKGARVLVAQLHDGQCGPMACKVNGLWSFDLGASTWTKVVDQWSSPHAYAGARPFLVQQEARRILEPSDGVLVSTSLEPTNPTLADVALAQDGDLGPVSASAATVLGDGRIVETDGRAFRVLDPKIAAPRWERFGTATMPPSFDRGASVSADPRTGELLVFGTPQGTTADGTTTELYVLVADGTAITKVTTASTPPPRASHAALVVDGTLYVAGGTHGDTALDDVWAFDRAGSQWTKIATLPTPVAFPTLSLGANNELLVLGRSATTMQGDAKSSPTYAVERTTHAVRTMDGAPAAVPLWSTAPYRGCFIGYESGDTVDSSGPTVWRCTIDKGVIAWSSTKLAEHDFTLNELRGAASPDGLHAYFVGRHLWEAVGK